MLRGAVGVGLAVLSLLPGCSCGEDAGALVVDLKTDLVPGIEFGGIRTEVHTAEIPGAGDTPVARIDLPAYFGEAWIEGRRAAEVDDLQPRTYSVRVTLLDASGAVVASRLSRVRISGRTTATIVITRDCRDVVCSPAQTCAAGACVDPSCTAEHPELCPPPECRSDTDCMPMASCAVGQCDTGACLFSDADRCADLEYCDPEEGCLPVPEMDAGTRDAGTDAGPDAGPDPACVAAGDEVSCWPGSPETRTVGACRDGHTICTGPGVPGFCSGALLPGPESCNGEDDDCNGVVDDGLGMIECGLGSCRRTGTICVAGAVESCLPGIPMPEICTNGIDEDCDGLADDGCDDCIRVSGSGSDTTGDGLGTPFQTVQGALMYAAGGAGRPRRICVAVGPTCGATFSFPGDFVVDAGIRVEGNYESSGWTRCAGATTHTVLGNTTPPDGPGIVLAGDGSTLDGFDVRPTPLATTISTAITVRAGARDVVISNVAVAPPTRDTEQSYGIVIEEGASASVIASRVEAGRGSSQNVAIFATRAELVVRDSCAGLLPDGTCGVICDAPGPGILATAPSGVGIAHGIRLDSATRAWIATSAVCADGGLDNAGIQLAGAAPDVRILGNSVYASGAARLGIGVQTDECDGDSPWIVANPSIRASPAAGDGIGVSAYGNCHPRIEANREIFGCGSGSANPACLGIACAGGSLCRVIGNVRLSGSTDIADALSAAIECRDGCARLSRNGIELGQADIQRGINLDRAGPLVDRNDIEVRCPSSSLAAGIATTGSWSRIENNSIHLEGCVSGDPATGILATISATGGELDIHSNTIGFAGPECPGTSIAWLAGAGGPARAGIIRNNILYAATCDPPVPAFTEENASVDPRIFQNNELWVGAAPGALYLDEGTLPVTLVAGVNALAEARGGGNILGSPGTELEFAL